MAPGGPGGAKRPREEEAAAAAAPAGPSAGHGPQGGKRRRGPGGLGAGRGLGLGRLAGLGRAALQLPGRLLGAALGRRGPPPGPLRPDLLGAASVARLRAELAASGPYRHVTIEDVAVAERLAGVRAEMIGSLRAVPKETDIYKVMQTGDLANIDGLDAQEAGLLPQLTALRDAIYSKRFRRFVEEVTGCGELVDKVDCSSNVYVQGSHLLCHDDVIGTRWVSYIIYLTDPAEEWTPQDGGALELFPVAPGGRAEPALSPSRAILPKWNSMAMFPVQPGRSFHSVQEVFQNHNPRLSISGWFHGATPPPGAERASLHQIEDAAALAAAGAGYEPVPGPPPSPVRPAAAGGDVLRRWINPQYLDEATVAQIAARFKVDSSVQLHKFLRADKAQDLLTLMQKADVRDGLGAGRVPEHGAGLGRGWEGVGPAHKQRFAQLRGAQDRLQRELTALQGFFASPELARYLARLAAVRVTAKLTDVPVRRFRPGLDYTLAHSTARESRLDATLCFVDASTADKKASWDFGEVGGYECYMLPETDEGNRDAAVYRANEVDDDLLSVSSAFNCLNLCLLTEGVMHFVKYVSAAAPGSRFDVAQKYRVEIPSDSEGEGGPGEEEEEGLSSDGDGGVSF